jgi:hypothetical protein
MTLVNVATRSAATRIERLDPEAKKFLSIQPGGDRARDIYLKPTRSFADIVPLEYHDFASVFSKKEASKLSEHRSYDHRIPLEEGTTPPYGPIYSLSPVELETL